jgi:hypothetical protein
MLDCHKNGVLEIQTQANYHIDTDSHTAPKKSTTRQAK